MRALGAVLVPAIAALAVLGSPAQARATALTQAQYLSRAEQGIAGASAWANAKRHWYNEVLLDQSTFPQATLWGIVPLFEAVDYVAMTDPSETNMTQLEHFVTKAEAYLDSNVTPVPGMSTQAPAYAPYPGSRGNPETFFDDNAWWSLAFLDAYQAAKDANDLPLAIRCLTDAERGFNLINTYGWDTQDVGGPLSVLSTPGGMWWNTYHAIPGGTGRSGEALGAATDLAARLYQLTGQGVYLQAAENYIGWANANLLKWDGSYATAIPNEVTMPHDGEGAMIAAYTALCQSNSGPVPAGPVPLSLYSFLPPNKIHRHPSFRLPADPTSWCSWAESLATDTAFGVNPGAGIKDAYVPLSEGPQWDAIYVRGLLTLYAYDQDPAWYQVATDAANSILTKARVANGLYVKTWAGSTSVPGSAVGEIRTHGANVSVLAALAAVGPPS